MADVSKIKLGSTTYNIKDGSAVTNITRSGTTFTATKRDGTTFTFTQQDNNSDTLVSQTATTTASNYEVLFSGTADNTTRTEGARKAEGLTFNPSTATLRIKGTTSNSDAYNSTNPKIQFDDGDSSQNGQLIYSDYDGIDAGASLTFISNQAKSWLRAPYIRATTELLSNGNITLGNGTTGQIKAVTPSRTGAIITVGGSKKAAGDANGTAIRLGAGGATLIGAGEYADNRYNVGDIADGDEKLFIGSDNGVYIETNGNTIADRKTFTFGTDGTFNSPSTIKQNGTAVSLSGHTHSFTPAGTIAVQTAGSTTSITPVSSKTVVTSASGATAAYASGNITFTNGSFGTGASVTTGTAVTVKTGDAAYKFTGTAGTTGA